MVGKTGVAGVMAEKLLSITAAAAGLPGPVSITRNTLQPYTCTRSFSRARRGIMWPLTPTPETRGMAALWPCLRYTPVKYGFSMYTYGREGGEL